MYRIIYPINNNVALVKNEQNKESVVMGKGIAFQKKKGDVIGEHHIEKIFKLKTAESKENLLTLLKDIPLDFITVTYDVIDDMIQKYQYPLQEYIYVTLTDHLYCSYQAVMKGQYQDSDLPDISATYQTEYQMARDALVQFRKRLLAVFPDDEISRIAFHFMNAKGISSKETTDNLHQTKDILSLIEQELKLQGIHRTDKNSHFYNRFMIHLSYFLDDLNRSHTDNHSLSEMENHVQSSYPKAYAIGSRLYDLIAHETGRDLHQSEKVYLVLHIQRIL